MTAAELAKLIEIRDGFKSAYWDFDKWRWAAKFDQFIRDAEHEQEGASEALGEPKASEHLPSSDAREAALRIIECTDSKGEINNMQPGDLALVARAYLALCPLPAPPVGGGSSLA
jgi:molecular chaperone GrpE (heat shock protein)